MTFSFIITVHLYLLLVHRDLPPFHRWERTDIKRQPWSLTRVSLWNHNPRTGTLEVPKPFLWIFKTNTKKSLYIYETGNGKLHMLYKIVYPTHKNKRHNKTSTKVNHNGLTLRRKDGFKFLHSQREPRSL